MLDGLFLLVVLLVIIVILVVWQRRPSGAKGVSSVSRDEDRPEIDWDARARIDIEAERADRRMRQQYRKAYQRVCAEYEDEEEK